MSNIWTNEICFKKITNQTKNVKMKIIERSNECIGKSYIPLFTR